MKILAAALATCLLAAPAFAQSGADQGKPPAGQEPQQAPAGTTPDKPADTAAPADEPTEAPEGTTPDKPAAPADAPQA
ncbi:MAG TPA: hypothetical protein VMG08_18150 [Allosphingosinicella sp.]|nr:hypothetical protein [Allosphingosinicella sp.]